MPWGRHRRAPRRAHPRVQADPGGEPGRSDVRGRRGRRFRRGAGRSNLGRRRPRALPKRPSRDIWNAHELLPSATLGFPPPHRPLRRARWSWRPRVLRDGRVPRGWHLNVHRERLEIGALDGVRGGTRGLARAKARATEGRGVAPVSRSPATVHHLSPGGDRRRPSFAGARPGGTRVSAGGRARGPIEHPDTRGGVVCCTR